MTTFKETHWFLFNKVVQTCLAKYLQRTLYAQNSLRIVCLIFCMLWRGIDTDQREWFISHFFIHRAKVVTLLARSIHHCKIFMCSFERRREKKIQRNFITMKKTGMNWTYHCLLCWFHHRFHQLLCCCFRYVHV